MIAAHLRERCPPFSPAQFRLPDAKSLPTSKGVNRMKRIFAATLILAGLSIISISAFAQSESRDDLIKQIETKRAELAVLEKQILEPSEQDRLAYSEFLQQPKTG